MTMESQQQWAFRLPLVDEEPDWPLLRSARVPGPEKSLLIGRRKDLRTHLDELSREFAGEPQLHLYHAVLIVHIRRNVLREQAASQFSAIWRANSDHLLEGLSSRWLVSACDTIMDCSSEPYEQAIACAASMLMNTIKLYETERFCTSRGAIDYDRVRMPVPLFDGMTTFAAGRGDMIWNLRQRSRSICRQDSVAAKIFLELLKRADRLDTIYRRLLDVHVDDGTRWN